MHRLSIMDPNHGWQPFWSEDGRWGILGNGEIYNASELRRTLQNLGHVLATGSDMEVIPHLVEEYGFEAFGRLRGMFALVLIDRRDGVVTLVRDRLGEKPLCFWQGDGAFYFASEQGALVRSGIVPMSVDRDLLPGYLLHGYTPEPHSLITGVHKVRAAHYMTIRLIDGEVSAFRYWDPLSEVGHAVLSDKTISEAIEDAVVSTCTSDVPVGIALSGGLDSSIVAAIATRARTDLRAFTVGYSEGGPDESSLAQGLAEHLGIPCITTILHTDEVARDFAEVCAARDEPISDIAGPALSALPLAARTAGVPVLLSGIGGDELFWGYDWMRQLAAWSTTYLQDREAGRNVHRARFSPLPRVRQAQVDWIAGLGGIRMDREMRSFVAQGASTGEFPLPYYEFQPGYLTIRRAMDELVGKRQRPPGAEFTGVGRAEWMAAYYTAASNDTYLRVNSFVQVDRLAMSHSIESRTPLADNQLVSTILSGRLASRDHFSPPKDRLREIARTFLPDEVVDRPKRGFTPPVRDWIRAIWRENGDALSADASIGLAGLPAQATLKWLEKPISRSGRVNQVALRLMTLELWLRSLA
jgi:asparagine synthase (glutamine-hydrolysing)